MRTKASRKCFSSNRMKCARLPTKTEAANTKGSRASRYRRREIARNLLRFRPVEFLNLEDGFHFALAFLLAAHRYETECRRVPETRDATRSGPRADVDQRLLRTDRRLERFLPFDLVLVFL